MFISSTNTSKFWKQFHIYSKIQKYLDTWKIAVIILKFE